MGLPQPTYLRPTRTARRSVPSLPARRRPVDSALTIAGEYAPPAHGPAPLDRPAPVLAGPSPGVQRATERDGDDSPPPRVEMVAADAGESQHAEGLALVRSLPLRPEQQIDGLPGQRLWLRCHPGPQPRKRGRSSLSVISPPRTRPSAFRRLQRTSPTCGEPRQAGRCCLPFWW